MKEFASVQQIQQHIDNHGKRVRVFIRMQLNIWVTLETVDNNTHTHTRYNHQLMLIFNSAAAAPQTQIR